MRVFQHTDRFFVDAMSRNQCRQRLDSRGAPIVVPPVLGDASQLLDRVGRQRGKTVLRSRENLHSAEDVHNCRTQKWIGIGGTQHPEQVGFGGLDLIGTFVRQSPDGQRHRANRTGHLARVRWNRAGSHQRFERAFNELALAVGRQSRAAERLSHGLRGFISRPEGQIWQEFRDEFTAFESANGADRPARGNDVLRSRELHEQAKIVRLLGAQGVDSRSVEIVWQEEAGIFRRQNRHLRRGTIRR